MPRLLTFNLWADHLASPRWTGRRDGVVALIRRHQPDIVGFQEATLDRVDFLAGELPEYAWYGVGRDDGKTGGELNPVFYRKEIFQPERCLTIWLSPNPTEVSRGWDAACHRIATFCELRAGGISGRSLLVVNTHLDHLGGKARKESVRLLLQRIAHWGPDLPVSLMGDFNCAETSAAYRELVEGAGGLKDARSICETTGEGPSFTWRGFLGSGLGKKRLDYIFVRHWRVCRHAVLPDRSQGRHPSDHYPVLCELEWVPAAPAGDGMGSAVKKDQSPGDGANPLAR